MASDLSTDFLADLDAAVMARKGKPERGELRFRCPSGQHEDRHPSARWNREEAIWYCDACGTGGGALDLADRLDVEKPRRAGEGGANPPKHHRTTAPPGGCTLAHYAAAKRLPLDFLRRIGLSEIVYQGAPAVRIPFLRPDGTEQAVQFRVALHKPADGGDRFKWRSGSKTLLCGLDRLADARERGSIALVEGASDCHTLWYHDEPAVGLPGAGNWNEERDAAHLDGIGRINVVIEPDSGGEAVRSWLASSSIRSRAWLVELGEYKDPSALHVADPARFAERWQAALATAVPFAEVERREREAVAAAAKAACADLAGADNILDLVAGAIEARGVVGARRNTKLLYLIVTSRFLSRPVSAGIKGPSSAGKSYELQAVLDMFPPEAYYALSAMSDRALAYDDEPLAHRYLVLYEAAGMSGEMVTYLIRSLLSEGVVRYVTVERTADGLRPRTIERPGPTGLLVTTTAVRLHAENETRMLSIPVSDAQEQTRRIFQALASEGRPAADLAPWQALQTWLSHAEHRVVVSFASALAELVPPVAVRLRRDFGLVLALVRAHAILHQASRDRDDAGRIIATLDDYAAVRELVADLIAEGVEATVPPTIRQTVGVVRSIVAPGTAGTTGGLAGRVREDSDRHASLVEIAKRLRLDKSAASRRVRVAIDAGYLRNLEDKRGRPARIALGDPLPDDVPILPTVEALRDRCSDAVMRQRYSPPPPSPATDAELEEMVSRILALTPAELTAYRAELDAASTDDPWIPREREALRRAYPA